MLQGVNQPHGLVHWSQNGLMPQPTAIAQHVPDWTPSGRPSDVGVFAQGSANSIVNVDGVWQMPADLPADPTGMAPNQPLVHPNEPILTVESDRVNGAASKSQAEAGRAGSLPGTGSRLIQIDADPHQGSMVHPQQNLRPAWC